MPDLGNSESINGDQHGAHVPGKGWYDASRSAWVDNPAKITPTSRSGGGIAPRPLDGLAFRDTTISTAEAIDTAHAATWHPDERVEQLRKIRDTNPTLYRQMPATDKMSVGSYEQGLRAHVDRGNDLPTGVRPLPNDAA